MSFISRVTSAGTYPEASAFRRMGAEEMADKKALVCSVLASLPAGEGLETEPIRSVLCATRPEAYSLLRALKAEGIVYNTLERRNTARVGIYGWLNKANVATWYLSSEV